MSEHGDGDDTTDALAFLKGKDAAPTGGSNPGEKKDWDSNIDAHRYKMDYRCLGDCIIINNKNFDKHTQMSTRNGTDLDAACAARTFTKLGYKTQVYNDLTVNKMRQLFSDVAKADHSNSASFVCVLLSHGEEDVIYGTDGFERFENLTKYFKGNQCRSLVGKPKLFFIQACRGSDLDDGVETDSDVLNIKSERIPVEADFLYAYSTTPGYYSWRNTTNGSWFIQSLCEMLGKFSKTLELMQIMTRVNYSVTRNFESSSTLPGFSGKKQMPCIISMLTKDFYFPGYSKP